MQLFGQPRLYAFARQHANARIAIDNWIARVERAQWQTPSDIKQAYKHASFLSESRVVFNLKGNSYRLLASINYRRQEVLVRWIMTHAEYDRQRL